MIAYGDISWQEPENTGFFQDVSLPGRQTPNRGKMAYLGISWHIFPCKSGKKNGKVRGHTTQKKAHSLRNTNNLLLQFTIIIQHIL